jgi:hypothetical protein
MTHTDSHMLELEIEEVESFDAPSEATDILVCLAVVAVVCAPILVLT